MPAFTPGPYRTCAVLTVVLLACIGCREDPCREMRPPAEARGSGGPATLVAHITGQIGTPGRRNTAIPCIDLLILNTHAYTDTLAHTRIDTQSGRLQIAHLPASTVDVIIDRKGYFPVKLTGVTLTAGKNVLEDRILMYKSSANIVLPGQLAFTLKPDATLPHVEHIYKNYDEVRVNAAPGSYELKLPWRGRQTFSFTETLCRKLVHSPYVQEARPLASMTAVIPGL